MNTYYKTIHKCRMCGQLTSHIIIDKRVQALKSIHKAISGYQDKDKLTPEMMEYHQCKNGNIGVSDFIGFEQVVE